LRSICWNSAVFCASSVIFSFGESACPAAAIGVRIIAKAIKTRKRRKILAGQLASPALLSEAFTAFSSSLAGGFLRIGDLNLHIGGAATERDRAIIAAKIGTAAGCGIAAPPPNCA
jgi:hypothetical protein